MPIRIISTYAPHNGHTEEEKTTLGRCKRPAQKDMQAEHHNLGIRRQWATWKQIPRRRRRRRRSKICQKEYADRKIIGPYTKASNTERGHVAQLHRICRRQQMIPTTTWKTPKIARQDKWKKHQEGGTQENWETENQDKYTTAWAIPGGNVRRQIDYIMIHAKHGYVTRKAQSNI